MTNQPTTNQSPHSSLKVSAAISQAIYHLICQTSQQRPELIASKYRSTPWSLVQTTFLSKIQHNLAKFSAPQALEKKIEEILHIFLEPKFFLLPQATRIQTKIKNLIPVDLIPIVNMPEIINQPSNHLSNQSGNQIIDQSTNQPSFFRRDNTSESKNQNGSINNQGIAILLLDVENLQLDAATEKFLAKICQYPIQIKIAFANWRHMGKQDLEFHQRGYELIHVPAGKDSADVKLATVGSSIFVHYPTAKEVLVCSSDAVLTHLCTTLQTHGLGVYLVRKKGEILTALDMKTGNTYSRMLRMSTDINSLAQLISQLQKIINTEQKLTGKNWILLSRVSQLFRSKYHLTISQVVSMYLPGQKARDVFLGHPNIFVVHRPNKEKNLYVSLFDNLSIGSQEHLGFVASPHSLSVQSSVGEMASNNGINGARNGVKLLDNSSSEVTSPAMINGSQESIPLSSISFASQRDIEIVLVKLIKELTHNEQSKSVYVGVLGNQFSRRYGRKITDVVKSLKLASTFSLFLESSPLFHLNKTESQVTVSLV
jgi:hypothetical protein